MAYVYNTENSRVEIDSSSRVKMQIEYDEMLKVIRDISKMAKDSSLNMHTRITQLMMISELTDTILNKYKDDTNNPNQLKKKEPCSVILNGRVTIFEDTFVTIGDILAKLGNVSIGSPVIKWKQQKNGFSGTFDKGMLILTPDMFIEVVYAV